MSQEEGQLTKEEYDKAIAGINKVAESVSKMEWNYERLKSKREKLLLQIVVSYWKSIALKDDFLYPIRLTFSTYEYDCGMLNENLTKELLSLDGVISNGNEEIRTKRKEQVKRILNLQDKITQMHKQAVALSMFYRSCLSQHRYQALLESDTPIVETPSSPVAPEEPTITTPDDEPTLQKQPSLKRKKSVHTIPVLSPEEFEARRNAMKEATEENTMEMEEDSLEDKKAKKRAKKHARKVAKRKEREEAEREREEEKRKAEEEERERKEEEERERKAEEERKKKAEEERKKAEEEAKRKEEERKREEAKKKAEEEKKREEEEAERKEAEERKAKEEAERKKAEEEERKAEEEAERKRKEAEEAKQAERKKAEEERKRKEEAEKQQKESSEMDVESDESSDSDSSMEVDSTKPEITEEDDLASIKSDYSPKYEWMVKEGKLNLILLDVDFDQKSLRCITRPSKPTPKLIIQGYRVVRRERPNGYYGMFYNTAPAYQYVPFTTVIPLPDVEVDLSRTPEALYYDDQSILQISYALKPKKEEPRRIPVREEEEEDNGVRNPFYPDRRYPNYYRDPRYDEGDNDEDSYYSNPYYRNPYNPYRQRRYANPRRSYSPFDSFFGGNAW